MSNLLMKLIRRSLLFGLVTATLAGCVFGLYSYRLSVAQTLLSTSRMSFQGRSNHGHFKIFVSD